MSAKSVAVSDDTEESIEARRAARRERRGDARQVQYLIDLKALDALEEQHGDDQVKAIHAPAFVSGLATMVIVKSPAGTGAHKRFGDQARAAKGHQPAIQAAGEQLARACIVYPAEDMRPLMVDAFPNLLNDAFTAVNGMLAFTSEAEKKA